MEIHEKHLANLTDNLARDTGILEDPMEMDDDETSRRAYGTDDLALDDTDSGQPQNRGAPSQKSGKKKATRSKRSGNKGGEFRKQMLAKIDKRLLGPQGGNS